MAAASSCCKPEMVCLSVASLMRAITADARHTDLRVLLQAPRPAAAAAGSWRAGFVDAEAMDAFAALDTADPEALLDGLLREQAGGEQHTRLHRVEHQGFGLAFAHALALSWWTRIGIA